MSTLNDRFASSLLSFATLFVVALAGCQAPGSTPVSAPIPAPRLVLGDHWQYKITDNLRRGAVTMMEVEVTAIANGIVTLHETSVGPYGRSEENEEITAERWLVSGSLKNETFRRFPTPIELYDFPLAQGKTWRQTVATTSPETQLPAQILSYGTVQGLRQVTVPAGSFNAVYIYRILQLDDDQFFRSRTERRDSVWYAPEVKAPARELHDASYVLYDGSESTLVRTENTTRELISFQPGRT
ncbi:MAG TPA: hypothetical protein VGH59_03525 [Casimicrobiaceae bacterium]